MADESSIQVYMKILAKPLSEITPEEHTSLTSMFRNNKFVSQLKYYKVIDKQNELNSETIKHFQQEVENQEESKTKNDSLFKHSCSDEFDSSALPQKFKFSSEFNEINLWGQYLEQEHEKFKNKSKESENFKIILDLKWLYLYSTLKKRNYLRKLFLQNLFMLKNPEKNKNNSESLARLSFTLNKIWEQRIRSVFSTLSDRTKKPKLVKLAIKIFVLSIQNRVQKFFNSFKLKTKTSLLDDYTKTIKRMKVVGRFSILRQAKLEKDLENKVKRIFLLKISSIIKILKYRAFFNFKATVKYLYDCMYSTEIVKEVTINEKHMHPLPDNLFLILSENKKFKIEKCDYKGSVVDSFFTDDFEARNVLKKVEDDQNAAKERLRKEFEEKYKEKDTQVDDSALESEVESLNSFKAGNKNFDCAPVEIFENRIVNIENFRIKRSKTDEPVKGFKGSDRVQDFEKVRKLKKLCLRQKIHEKQNIKRSFNRLLEIKSKSNVNKAATLKLQNYFLQIFKTRYSDFFDNLIIKAEKIEFLVTFLKSFERKIAKIVKKRTKMVFNKLTEVNKKPFIDKLFFYFKNQVKVKEIKVFYLWKSQVDVKCGLSRYCSPLRNDYILTDFDSEENSRDYEYTNLMLAKTFKQDFEGMAKAYEQSCNIDKLIRKLQTLHEKQGMRKLFSNYNRLKIGEKYQSLTISMKKKNIVSMIRVLIKHLSALKKLARVLNKVMILGVRQFKLNKVLKKIDPKVIGALNIIHKVSKDFKKKVFFYIVEPKVSETVEKTKMMKKSKGKVLRSGRNPPKHMQMNFTPLILRTLRPILNSIIRASQDLLIKKKAFMNLAKIVKKMVQTGINRWIKYNKLEKPKTASKPDNLKRFKSKMVSLSILFQKFLRVQFSKWKTFSFKMRILKAKISSLSKIFYKGLRMHFTKYQVYSKDSIKVVKKVDAKITKNKAKNQLRAVRTEKKTNGTLIVQKILLRFLRCKLANWKKNSDLLVSKKHNKQELLNRSLKNLKNNFAMFLRRWLLKWSSKCSLAAKKHSSLEQACFSKYKETQDRKIMTNALKTIAFSRLNRYKVAFIRWVNLYRLRRAKLLSDKQHNLVRTSKKLLAPIVFKCFASKQFLSFQHWKKFTSLTHALPKSKKLVLRTGKSLKYLFRRTLSAYFQVLIGTKNKKLRKCFEACNNRVANRLSSTFAKLKLKCSSMHGLKMNNGIKIKKFFERLLRKYILRPIIMHGLGDSKLKLVMTLIKRALLISYKAELEKFRINSMYTKINNQLKEKEKFSVKQSVAIFNNTAKKTVEKAFSNLKNFTKLKNTGTIITGLFFLKKLLRSRLKFLLYQQKSNSPLENSFKIFKRLLFILYKTSLERWKVNSLNSQLSQAVTSHSLKSKCSSLQNLRKIFISRMRRPIQIWSLSTKNHSVLIKSRQSHLPSLLKTLTYRSLSNSFTSLTEKQTKKYAKGLFRVFEKHTSKKKLKKAIEAFKQNVLQFVLSKNIQINNNLWQLKVSKERNTMHKELGQQTQKKASLAGLEQIFKQGVKNFKAFAFECLKINVEQLYGKTEDCKSAFKKIQIAYLSSLKRAFDKWNCQIKWIPERTMVSYSISLSKMFYIHDSACLKLTVKYFSEWKTKCSLIKLQKMYACMQIKRFKTLKPNFTGKIRLTNAVIKWKSLLTRNKSFQQLLNELKDVQSKSKAYQTELQNLKNNHSFLYSGLKNV